MFAVIIGVNIGDCLTTFLVSRIGAKPEQIRVATVHVIYNIFAALLIIVALTIGRLTGLINDEFWNATLNSGGVANVHGVFRLVPAVVLLPLSGTFANIAERIVPDKVEVDVESAEVDESLRDLDEHLVEQPSLALDRSGHSLKHMGLIAVRNCEMAMDLIFNFDSKKVDKIKKRESQLDRMCDEINKYLLAISPYIVLESNRHKQTFQMKASGSLERIGDHAENIVEDMIGFKDRGGIFSETAVNDLNVLKARIEAQLRRNARPEAQHPRIELPDLTIDLFSGTAELDGNVCSLPQRELQILYLLASRIGARISYHEIYETIYGCDVEDSKNTIRVNISRLKKHLAMDDMSTYQITATADGEYVLRRVIF